MNEQILKWIDDKARERYPMPDGKINDVDRAIAIGKNVGYKVALTQIWPLIEKAYNEWQVEGGHYDLYDFNDVIQSIIKPTT